MNAAKLSLMLSRAALLLLLFFLGTHLPRIYGFVLTSSSSPTACCMTSSTSLTAAAAASATTLGSTKLRTLVQNTSIASSSCLDMTGIVWLEHLNLVVGDMDIAMKFYVDFLGFSRDSNPKHVNLGQQQFHLAATDDPPQRITGSIGLTVPSLQNIKNRIELAKLDMKGTLFAINDESEKVMTITGPWGNTFHLYDISVDDDVSLTMDANQSARKMVEMHSEGGAYGAHRMAVRGQPGIRFVEFACPVSTASSIGEFYKNVLKCNSVMTKSIDNNNLCTIIGVGPCVHFVFVESLELTAESLDKMLGVHVCIYIPNFQHTYQQLKNRDLIWTNPRFTHLDCCDTWEEACASRTLRFKYILDVTTGKKLFELEHETRPMTHGQYMKVPTYNPN